MKRELDEELLKQITATANEITKAVQLHIQEFGKPDPEGVVHPMGCMGTAGTFGSAGGCMGTAGTFGCHILE